MNQIERFLVTGNVTYFLLQPIRPSPGSSSLPIVIESDSETPEPPSKKEIVYDDMYRFIDDWNGLLKLWLKDEFVTMSITEKVNQNTVKSVLESIHNAMDNMVKMQQNARKFDFSKKFYFNCIKSSESEKTQLRFIGGKLTKIYEDCKQDRVELRKSILTEMNYTQHALYDLKNMHTELVDPSCPHIVNQYDEKIFDFTLVDHYTNFEARRTKDNKIAIVKNISGFQIDHAGKNMLVLIEWKDLGYKHMTYEPLENITGINAKEMTIEVAKRLGWTEKNLTALQAALKP